MLEPASMQRLNGRAVSAVSLLVLAGAIFGLWACGGGQDSSGEPEETPEETPPAEPVLRGALRRFVAAGAGRPTIGVR